MSRQPCAECGEACPLSPNGFSDLHHLYKQAEADTALKRVFSNLVQNTVQIPRCVHQEVEALYGWLPYPADDVMRDIVRSEFESGNIFLSENKKRKILL